MCFLGKAEKGPDLFGVKITNIAYMHTCIYNLRSLHHWLLSCQGIGMYIYTCNHFVWHDSNCKCHAYLTQIDGNASLNIGYFGISSTASLPTTTFDET